MTSCARGRGGQGQFFEEWEGCRLVVMMRRYVMRYVMMKGIRRLKDQGIREGLILLPSCKTAV
tara:strand:+ start:207 stop:395 length:189 start_codon:yes stop_codon:yes gene_type:complete